MGYYINPKSMDKEAFLEKYGERLPAPPDYPVIGDKVVVCLVDNIAFTAAGIAVDMRELQDMKYPKDIRSKKWYLLPLTLAAEMAPGIKTKMPEFKNA